MEDFLDLAENTSVVLSHEIVSELPEPLSTPELPSTTSVEIHTPAELLEGAGNEFIQYELADTPWSSGQERQI